MGCSREAIQKIEAGTRRPSKQIAELLIACLEIPPEERPAFVRWARLGPEAAPPDLPLASAPPLSTAAASVAPVASTPPSNLPAPLTSLIGRDEEVEAVRRSLLRDDVRLLTLVGPPGIGKTRLGIAVAARLSVHFRDGVYFVALDTVNDTHLVIAAIGKSLGLKPSEKQPVAEAVAVYLRDKQLLLVLDNFEQVLDAGPEVLQLLSACPGLKALVTSREPLHAYGERRFQVPPLELPDRKRLPDLDVLAGLASVILFLQRAQARKPDLALTPANAGTIAAICLHLDGLPLAIELAAARIEDLAPEQILAGLGDRLKLLKGDLRYLPPRQQTLRGAIDWSYHLLTIGERTLFRRLGVFVGGCSLAAVQAVCNANHDLPFEPQAGMAALSSKSLLYRETGVEGEPRWGMLESIREYARERLGGSGEATEIHRLHAAYYTELAEAAEPKLRGAEQLAWLNRLENEHENLRVALEWSLRDRASDAQESVRLTGALHPFWKRRAHWSEGRDWLKRALAQSADSQVTQERVKALNAAVLLAADQADTGSAWRLAQENLALSRELGDAGSIAHSLNSLGFLLWKKKDFAAARASCERALGLCRELGDRLTVADSLHNLSHIAMNQGDYEAAQLYCGEAATIYRELEDEIGLDDALGDLGLVAYLRDDHAAARPYLEESLARFRRAASVPGVVSALNRLGDLARCQGDYAQAEMLYTECVAMYRDSGDKDEFPSLLHNLAYAVLHRGDCVQAIGLFKEGLAIQHEMGNQAGIAECLAGIASVVIAQGKAQQGAQLLSVAEALREASSTVWWPADRIEYEHSLALLHQSLSEAALAAAWVEGRGRPWGEVVADVLQISAQHFSRSPAVKCASND
ncbi:MAG TPA: tetratricopeptide repeat protein [Anaerolineae bacterium]|nr:tetratricopeptide repeat protein [Anaerolineae bacterium]